MNVEEHWDNEDTKNLIIEIQISFGNHTWFIICGPGGYEIIKMRWIIIERIILREKMEHLDYAFLHWHSLALVVDHLDLDSAKEHNTYRKKDWEIVHYLRRHAISINKSLNKKLIDFKS
jgi:hypothetical protein